MRFPSVLLATLFVAGCMGSASSDDLVVKLENASSTERVITVNVDELAGTRVAHFLITAAGGEGATRGVDLPDVETVLVSVEADGKTVGARSVSQAKCAGKADPFLIQVQTDGNVTIIGKTC